MSKFWVIAPLALVAIVGCQAGTASPSPSPSDASASDIDRAFIDMMVPHHQAAIEMAELALERAERPELREAAGGIVEEQEGEIEQLRSWRQAWFGSAESPPMSAMPLMPGMEMPGMPGHAGGTMDMTVDIETLRSAEEFDRTFLELMIVHHRSAIDAAGIAQRDTQLPEVRALAARIIASQQAEIDEFRRWLAEWYGVTPAPAASATP
jgi:uncharacterized protein (DUF305 family)